jgi:uncharacterized membrane protein YhaH (DUF805 family)
MDFTKAIETFFARYFDFKGRSSRAEYWWFYLFYVLVTIATLIVDFIVFGEAGVDEIPLFQSLWALAASIGYLSLGIRRLHDIDRTGYWFLYGLAPFLLMILGIFAENNVISVIGILGVIGYAITIFVFTLLPGTKGVNRFGENPLDD